MLTKAKNLTLFYILTILFSSYGPLCAQEDVIKVKYEETVHFEITDNVQNSNSDFPTSSTLKKILLVKGSQSNYIFNKEDTEEPKDELNGKSRRRFWMINKKEDVLYQNIDEGLQLEKIDLFGKDFIVKEGIEKKKWKLIATEQRDILGYTCMKAEYRDSVNLVTAWFTPQITKSFGPAGYGGLPGLVLAISIGENRIILATEVTKPMEEVELFIPQEKNAKTREEFEKIRLEKIDERKAMWGGRRR
jgi:GLPGLI family protein